MATLTNPINAQNIVDRFADYVVATGNGGIEWGTNAIPTVSTGPVSGVTDVLEVVASSYFGGGTGGKSIGISGANITASPITALTIYNTLLSETGAYTRIRLVRGILNVTGGGGNNGTRLRTAAYPAPGPTPAPAGYINVYDSTKMANLSTTYLQTLGTVANGGVVKDTAINTTNLETLFNNLRTALTTARSNVTTVQVDVCHASCHSSCHGSRGRR